MRFEKIQKPIGGYEIFVFKNGQWKQAGILEYGKFLREKKIDLGQFLPAKEKIQIRLVQKGGGAAHIDAARLGNLAPSGLNGSGDENALKKIVKQDFDVLDAFRKTLELKFPADGKQTILKLTARVEPKTIEKTTFQFPSINLFRQIDSNSQFYNYVLIDSKSAATLKSESPLFREFCRTGSGHPYGFTYGWVSNDDSYLYATIEFLPDNTMDGDKDYAQLHVKTENGLLSFKVSELLRKWGDPAFVYTDKVPYQHKLYHFKVPFTAIGLKQPKAGRNLQLAFSAYGTAFPASPGPFIDAGFRHTVSLKLDGTLWAWGHNTDGQLGNGSTSNSTSPVQESSTSADWEAVSAGYSHTAALKSNGTLWAWGNNSNGQIGDGTAGNIRTSPVTVVDTAVDTDTDPDTDWVAVSAGGNHTLGLKSNGTLWAWGFNYNGQLGDGTTNSSPTPVQVSGGSDWVAVAAGDSHTLALKSNGTLWAWGHNFYGELGDGTRNDRDAPVQIGTQTDWVAVAAGSMHSAALRSDGTLWTWGFNAYGQLGDGTTEDQLSPVIVMDTVADPDTDPDTDWVAVAVNDRFTMALKSNGTLWAWGYNLVGQLGDGTNFDSLEPVQEITSATNWRTVAAGYQHAVAAQSDDSLWTWGWNSSGQLGDGTTDNKNTPNYVGDAIRRWMKIAAGEMHTIATMTDGTLWAWGYNADGQLGDNSTVNRNVPVQEYSRGFDWIEVAAGLYHSVALKSNGSLWAWGLNNYGQLGDNTTITKHAPVREYTNAEDWVAVTAGDYHTVALKSDGTLWSWGSNEYGQLGNNSTVNSSVAIQEYYQDTDWVAVAAGINHTLALKSDGSIWAWGHNEYGQLGIGSTIDTNIPTPIAGEANDSMH